MFYCRNEELRKLNKRYDAGNFECIVIYGRRRVGKTTIINEFCKGKPTVFFSALLEGTAKDNLKTLSRAIYTYNQPDATDAPEYNSFERTARLDPLAGQTAPGCLRLHHCAGEDL